MKSLSPEQEERAVRLHRENMVVDSLRCFVGPLAPLPAQLESKVYSHEKGSLVGAYEVSVDERIASLISHDPEFREAYLADWERSGVDLVNQTIGMVGSHPAAADEAIGSLASWTEIFDAVQGIRKVTCLQDVRVARECGQRGVILGFQDTSFLRGGLSNLTLFTRFGVRIIQLTYNMMNEMGSGCTEKRDPGLSFKGRELIKQLNGLGILIDVSHCGPTTTIDTIRVSEAPVAVTHATCKAVFPHDRGKTDEAIELLAENGGYFGVAIVPAFLTSDAHPTVDHFLAHVDHAVQLVGAEHVGIGTDWGAAYPEHFASELNQSNADFGFRPEHKLDHTVKPRGYEDWAMWANLTRGLVGLGYDDDQISSIIGGSFLTVFGKVVG